MTEYYDNWMGGLAMHLLGPRVVQLLLNAFVVIVGFLILSGAVNTSIVGSNGVLSRVAEDGVLPDWFLRPHKRLGTNYRLLYLIAGLQILTILISRGDVILLGEAYAFGVVWSFVFNTLSMVVLRFKKRGPREFVVPWNIHIGDTVLADRALDRLPDHDLFGAGEPVHEAGGHDQRHLLRRRVPFACSPSPSASIAGAAAADIMSTSSSSTSIHRPSR